MTMIAIENFAASTTVEDTGGKMVTVNCRVVGLVKNEDDGFDFVVMVEDSGDRWPARRDYVSAPDGKSYWPDQPSSAR